MHLTLEPRFDQVQRVHHPRKVCCEKGGRHVLHREQIIVPTHAHSFPFIDKNIIPYRKLFKLIFRRAVLDPTGRQAPDPGRRE